MYDVVAHKCDGSPQELEKAYLNAIAENQKERKYEYRQFLGWYFEKCGTVINKKMDLVQFGQRKLKVSISEDLLEALVMLKETSSIDISQNEKLIFDLPNFSVDPRWPSANWV